MSDPFGQFARPIKEALKEWGLDLAGGRVESLAGFSGDGVFRVELSPDCTREDSPLHEPTWMVVKAIDTSKRARPLGRMADRDSPLVRNNATIECLRDLPLGEWRVRLFDWNGPSQTLRDIAHEALGRKAGAVEQLKQAMDAIPADWLERTASGTRSMTWSEVVRSWPLEFLSRASTHDVRRRRAYAVVTTGVVVGPANSGYLVDPVILLQSLIEMPEDSGCKHTLRKGCLHGDLHGGNLLISREQGNLRWTTIDLEDSQSDSTPLGYDVGLLEASLFCQLLASEPHPTQTWVLNELMGGGKTLRHGLSGDGALLQLKTFRESVQRWLQKKGRRTISPEHHAQFMLGRVAAGVVLASYEFSKKYSAWPEAAARFAAHAAGAFLNLVRESDPDFAYPDVMPPLPLPRQSELWVPGNLRMILAALCLSSAVKIEDIAREVFPLHGMPGLLSAVRGTALEDPRQDKLFGLAKRVGMFEINDEMRAFLRTPPHELAMNPHWQASPHDEHPARRELCDLLRRSIEYKAQRWLDGARKRIRELDLSGDDDWTYRTKLRDIYAYAATHLGASDMLAAAREDFNVLSAGSRPRNRWKELIDSDPEHSGSHLAFSGRVIAEVVAQTIRDQKLEFPEFRMVEGGVGGGQTTYFVMKELLKLNGVPHAVRSRAALAYTGFEIVPETTEVVNGWLGGVNYHPGYRSHDGDSRTEFFGTLQVQGLIKPLRGNRFVQCMPMERGIDELLSQQQNHISLFVSSYAFHHVPNGDAIRHYLSNTTPSCTTAIGMEREDANVATDPFGRAVLAYIRTLSGRLWRAHNDRTRSHELVTLDYEIANLPIDTCGPAKVALSLLNTGMDQHGMNKFLSGLDALREGRPPACDWSETLSEALINPQTLMLGRLVALLAPGGFVAIADPDGTSYFNRDGVRDDDPELSVANFLLREELEELFTKKYGLRLVASWTVARERVAGKLGLLRKVRQPDPSQPRGGPGEDPNLGYIVVAQKPSNFVLRNESHRRRLWTSMEHPT